MGLLYLSLIISRFFLKVNLGKSSTSRGSYGSYVYMLPEGTFQLLPTFVAPRCREKQAEHELQQVSGGHCLVGG